MYIYIYIYANQDCSSILSTGAILWQIGRPTNFAVVTTHMCLLPP